jgi:hypothetical protein
MAVTTMNKPVDVLDEMQTLKASGEPFAVTTVVRTVAQLDRAHERRPGAEHRDQKGRLCPGDPRRAPNAYTACVEF